MDSPEHPHQTHCIRCGECCLTSSPTLQIVDLRLVEQGAIGRDRLYTLRKGELVMDNVRNELKVSDEELIKIRERDGGGCVFYDACHKACAIYESRPAQCAAFACWDTRGFMEVYGTSRLTRRDLVTDGVLLGLMEKHEERCGYENLEALVKDVRERGERAVGQILDIIRFDYRLRPFVAEKLAIPAAEMDFLFGRPLTRTVAMFGLKTIRGADGGFLLTTARNAE